VELADEQKLRDGPLDGDAEGGDPSLVEGGGTGPADAEGPLIEPSRQALELSHARLYPLLEDLVHPGDEEHHGRPDLEDVVPQVPRPLGVGDARAPGQGQVVGGHALEDVAQGQEGDQDIAPSEAEDLVGGAHVGHEVGVGEHDALGLAGGAAGVDDASELVGHHLDPRRVVALLGQRGAIGQLQDGVEGHGAVGQRSRRIHHDDADIHVVGGGLQDGAEEAGVAHDDQPRAGVVEDVADLGGRQGGEEGHVDGP